MACLLVSLTQQGNIDTKSLDRFKIGNELKKFKNQFGHIDYPVLFNIPEKDRLPTLAKKDVGTAIKLIAVAITMAMETMNLTRPMNDFQIVDLSEEVIDSLNEGDCLSIEDFMLFIQKLTRGEYGAVYEGMDKAKFMGFFSQYRDERWEACKKIKEEKDLEFKSLGPTREIESTNPLDIHLSEMSNKVQQLKDELKEQKNINKRLREDF